MSHVTTQLLEPTTCHWLRLDELPQLPTLADHLLIRLEHIRSHFLSNMFGDFSDTGRAAALLMSMVVNIDTDREEDLTGLGGILTRMSQERGTPAMS